MPRIRESSPARRRSTPVERLYSARWVLAAVGAVALVGTTITASNALGRPSEAGSLEAVAAPSASAEPSAAPVVRFDDVVDGQNVSLALPFSGPATAIAVYFPGEGVGVDGTDPVFDGIRSQGWAVATSQFHDAGWGAATTSIDTRNLAVWASRRVNAQVGLFVSVREGAVDSLNAMARSEEAPRCWYGIDPIVDLLSVIDRDDWREQIISAIGEDAPADANPVETISRLPFETDYRVLSTAGDPSVDEGDNAAELVAGLTAIGAPVTSSPGLPTGAAIDSADLATFAEGCLT